MVSDKQKLTKKIPVQNKLSRIISILIHKAVKMSAYVSKLLTIIFNKNL